MTSGPADNPRFDLGPWIESPSSTRVRAYRYDYANQSLQLTWSNQKNHGYIYEGVEPQGYQNFARAVSKGKMVNRILNGYDYRPMTEDEVQAPSNPNRRALTSRVRR